MLVLCCVLKVWCEDYVDCVKVNVVVVVVVGWVFIEDDVVVYMCEIYLSLLVYLCSVWCYSVILLVLLVGVLVFGCLVWGVI